MPVLFEYLITFIKIKENKNLQCYVRIRSTFSGKVNLFSYVTFEICMRHVEKDNISKKYNKIREKQKIDVQTDIHGISELTVLQTTEYVNIYNYFYLHIPKK